MRFARRRRAAGFTLIETLVALAIVGMALAAVAGVFSNGLAAHETAAEAETALALAEERLALATAIASPSVGTEKGIFGELFAWQTTVAPYEEPTHGNGLTPAKALPRLYRVSVSVAWRDGHRARQLALSTLRLGAATP